MSREVLSERRRPRRPWIGAQKWSSIHTLHSGDTKETYDRTTQRILFIIFTIGLTVESEHIAEVHLSLVDGKTFETKVLTRFQRNLRIVVWKTHGKASKVHNTSTDGPISNL